MLFLGIVGYLKGGNFIKIVVSKFFVINAYWLAYLSIYLSIYLPTYLPYLPTYLPTYLSIYLPTPTYVPLPT